MNCPELPDEPSDVTSDESPPLLPKATATRRARSSAACGGEAAEAGCIEPSEAFALTLAGGMQMLSLHGWYSSVTATSAPESGLKLAAALSGTMNFNVPVKTESFSPPENAGAISSAGGYATVPAFTAAGGVTESVVRMKSAEFGWLELICHPGRISAATSSWLVAPGLSAPPSFRVWILTTSEGLGRSSCAFAACGHASRAAMAIAKTAIANAPADQTVAPAGPRLELRSLERRHRRRYRFIT